MNIKVKPLVWKSSHESVSYPQHNAMAWQIKFHACIDTSRALCFGRFPLAIDGVDCGRAPQTLEEAKAIAQGVFDRRVMAIIETYTEEVGPVDWSKPLELMDGTPVKLEAHNPDAWGVSNGPDGGPDPDGDYWIVPDDGSRMRSVDGGPRRYKSMCVHPDGCEEGAREQFVRNRA